MVRDLLSMEDECSKLQEPSSKVETVTERPFKRVAEDKSNLRKAELPEMKGQKEEGFLAAKRSKEKKQNPFLCVIPSCESVVTAEVFGFSRETALLEHYKMHLKKGEMPKFSAISLLDFCSCGGIKLKVQVCRDCGQGKE